MDIRWTSSSIEGMTAPDLFKILKLRSEVFVVEQNCVYLDLDEKDEQSIHVTGWINDELAAYARIVPPNISYTNAASIGRVCNALHYRGKGLGKRLMQEAMALCKTSYGDAYPIKISAQYYLLAFYQNLGFNQVSDIYLEDGIDHIAMLLNNKTSTQ